MHTCKNQVTTPIAGTVRSPDVKTQGFINSYDPRPYFTWLDRDPRHRPRKKTARRDVVSRDASSYLKLLTACATSCTLLREKSLCTIIYRNFTIKYKKKKKKSITSIIRHATIPRDPPCCDHVWRRYLDTILVTSLFTSHEQKDASATDFYILPFKPFALPNMISSLYWHVTRHILIVG